MEAKKIATVIIDDSKSEIKKLVGELETFSEIDLVKTCSNPQKAGKILKEIKPQLVFLDVEMPGKTGFDILKEMKTYKDFNATVVFYTAYDKYVLEALRQSAFDYLLKPVQYNELSNVISRFQKERFSGNNDFRKKLDKILPSGNSRVFIPSATGLRFLYKDEIVLFAFQHPKLNKSAWCALLIDQQTVEIKKKTNAKSIIQILQDPNYFKINQSAILNLRYLSAIEFKTRRCILIPPFNNFELVLSRSAFNELRDSFDIL
ncbi:MAG: hypothetical protein B6I20_08640 [Bacteroidetes bacterium 4572_117]|nr:MAG: hypothetical protein B6I20_08640 [Bacteroidetes bacterium 4572_117]